MSPYITDSGSERERKKSITCTGERLFGADFLVQLIHLEFNSCSK